GDQAGRAHVNSNPTPSSPPHPTPPPTPQDKMNREFAFSVISPGARPTDPEEATVFCFADQSDFVEWLEAVGHPCDLTPDAGEHALSIDIDGNFLDGDDKVVITRDAVLALAHQELSGTGDEAVPTAAAAGGAGAPLVAVADDSAPPPPPPHDDDAGSEYSE